MLYLEVTISQIFYFSEATVTWAATVSQSDANLVTESTGIKDG